MLLSWSFHEPSFWPKGIRSVWTALRQEPGGPAPVDRLCPGAAYALRPRFMQRLSRERAWPRRLRLVRHVSL